MPYIADTYVNNRQMDVKAAEKNGEFATMTARQLLSILRLAQAHAKLYFREEVKMEDVDEALRLVPPKQMSLEQCLEFLADDELLEVTPKSLRMRKAILDHEKRMKALHGKK